MKIAALSPQNYTTGMNVLKFGNNTPENKSSVPVNNAKTTQLLEEARNDVPFKSLISKLEEDITRGFPDLARYKEYLEKKTCSELDELETEIKAAKENLQKYGNIIAHKIYPKTPENHAEVEKAYKLLMKAAK